MHIKVFISLLFDIFAHGNAYAYETYEYIWKLAYVVCILVTGLQKWKNLSKRLKRNYQ